MKIRNHLLSGFTFHDDEYELRLEHIMYNTILLLISFTLLLLSFIRFFEENYIQSFLDTVFLFFSIFTIFYIRKSKYHGKKIAPVYITLFLFLISYVFLNTNAEIGASWFIVLIVPTYYIAGIRAGIAISLASVVAIFILGQVGENSFTPLRYFNNLMPLLLSAIFIYIYEKRVRRAKELLKEKNSSLEVEIAKKSEDEIILLQHNKELADVISKSNIELYIVDFESDKYLYVNQGGIKALGYSLEELQKMSVYDTNPSLTIETVNKLKSIKDTVPNIMNITQHKRKDGSMYGAQSFIHSIEYKGRSAYAIYDINLTDVHAAQSQLLKEKEELLKQAYYDNLTKLPNRILFNDRLKQAISKSNRSKKDFAIMFIDLDKFKEINDQLGHTIGDSVLCEVANRFQATLRDEDTISRFGGDEFVCIIEHLESCEPPANLAQKLINKIKEPLIIEGNSILLTCSIGISIYKKDATDEKTLLHHADIAMYRARDKGKDNYQFYSSC